MPNNITLTSLIGFYMYMACLHMYWQYQQMLFKSPHENLYDQLIQAYEHRVYCTSFPHAVELGNIIVTFCAFNPMK